MASVKTQGGLDVNVNTVEAAKNLETFLAPHLARLAAITAGAPSDAKTLAAVALMSDMRNGLDAAMRTVEAAGRGNWGDAVIP